MGGGGRERRGEKERGGGKEREGEERRGRIERERERKVGAGREK